MMMGSPREKGSSAHPRWPGMLVICVLNGAWATGFLAWFVHDVVAGHVVGAALMLVAVVFFGYSSWSMSPWGRHPNRGDPDTLDRFFTWLGIEWFTGPTGNVDDDAATIGAEEDGRKGRPEAP